MSDRGKDTMAKKKKTRIELIDVAKAVTIFLVILGHTTGNLDTSLFRRVLYSFHMPLFFFLAGMSIKPVPVKGWEQWRQFIRKNILALMVPYFIWGLIFAPFSFEIFPKLFYASWVALGEIGTLTSLWFLPAFFISRMMVQGIISLSFSIGSKRPKLLYTAAAVIMSTIGLLLPHLDQGYPWCLDVAFVASGFVLMGIVLRNHLLILAQQKWIVLCAVFAASLTLLHCSTVLRGDSLELILMCDSRYGSAFWFYVNSIAGTMTVLAFSMLFIRIAREGTRPFSFNVVTYIGMHTMGIFLLHKNLLQQLILPLLFRFLPDMGFFTLFLGSCIALCVSTLMCIVIEKYIPQLLGQFPKYEDSAAHN